MSNSIFKFTYILITALLCSVSFAQQKKFKAIIKWPAGLETAKMQVFVNNGLKTKTIDPVLNKNELIVSDYFVSKYVTISITINQNNYNLPTYSQFYISEKPATIIFNSELDSLKPCNAIYKTINAYDVGEITKKYNSFIEPLELERETHLQSGGMDSIYFSIFRKLIIKKLEFIKQNSDSYYAFKLFQSEIVPLQFPNQDSIVDTFLDFYTTNFSQDMQDSLEGMEVMKILKSKWIAFHDNIKAPPFTTTDILGNKISLESLKGQYIIINFWATWCAPCMAELPAIRKIREKYGKDRLSIISVSFDKNFELFSDAIKKNEMDWINIYNDEEFASKYGGKAALPKIFLIDKTGTIIYNRSAGKEIDFINLQVLNDILENELGK